ncbi:MAG: Uma2 family endonuclease [Cyanobacteria bacterium]|nr:Uma2 family endonuclease [Cyanobacteriota bacterium]
MQSGCQEVWLVMPESQWVMVITAQQQVLLSGEAMVTTQQVLPGFTISVATLLK